MTFFKATKENGTDFYSGTIDYAAALTSEATIKHPNPGKVGDERASGYISIATVPTDCTAFSWPCRLFEVEPVGEVWDPKTGHDFKRAVHELTVVREVEAWRVFGPRGEGCADILAAFAKLPYTKRDELASARDTAWGDAWGRVIAVAYGGRADRAGLRAARDALGGRLGGWRDADAAYCAALAVLFSGFPDLALSDEDYATITAPWRKVVGAAHPQDTLPIGVTK